MERSSCTNGPPPPTARATMSSLFTDCVSQLDAAHQLPKETWIIAFPEMKLASKRFILAQLFPSI